MKTAHYALIALCILALAWVVKMIIGVSRLSRFQEVPRAASTLELAAFSFAAALPMAAVWFAGGRHRRAAYLIWLPCVAYVMFLAMRLATQDFAAGILRLILWLAIAVLFKHAVRNPGQTNRTPLP